MAGIAVSTATGAYIPIRNLEQLGRLLNHWYAVDAGTQPPRPILVLGVHHQPGESELFHVSSVGVRLELSVAFPCGSSQCILMRACSATRP